MASVFFSYSHKDEALRDQLETHLASLRNEGIITAWHDRRLLAGDDFDHGIRAELETADVILLLVSPDFIASRYCRDVEVRRAVERHAEGTARVIPVILRPCDWQHTPFAHLQALPRDARPVTQWPDRDEAFLNVAQGIRAALSSVARSPASAKLAAPAAGQSARQASPTPSRSHAGPRSSNLRLRKEFSDADKDRFLDDAFEYMARFFENSLQEMEERNPGIQTRFKRLDAQAFSAVIYREGRAVARCGIRLDGTRGFMGGITFSADESAPTNSYNESLRVDADDQSMFLRSMGMASLWGGGVTKESHLTFEGAAELYWSLLIAPLQR